MSLNFFKYYGAKHYMLKHILKRIPAHSRYVEVFGGSAKVLLNKEPVPFETYNDTNKAIFNLFRWLQQDFEGFQRLAQLTLCHELNVTSPDEEDCMEDSLKNAVKFYARLHQSFMGSGNNFSISVNRLRRNVPENISSWLNKVDNLETIYRRLSQVQFLCRDFSSIFETFKGNSDTFFYVDPPYVLDTRQQKKVYQSELTNEQHEQLVNYLLSLGSPCLVSGYQHPIYQKLESNGYTLEQFLIESPNRKETKVECLWRNYAVPEFDPATK